MIDLRTYSFLTKKLFSEAKHKPSFIYKKDTDVLKQGGFTTEGGLVFIGTKYFYFLSKFHFEKQQILHTVFNSRWRKMVHCSFYDLRTSVNGAEPLFEGCLLLSVNTEVLLPEWVAEAKGIGFSSQKAEGREGFLCQRMVVLGTFKPLSQWNSDLQNTFLLHHPISFFVEKTSKLPKWRRYAKAIFLSPFTILIDALTLLIFHIIFFMIEKALNVTRKLKSFFDK